MCCLKYENDECEQKQNGNYRIAAKKLRLRMEKGKVVGLDLLQRIIKVRLYDRQTPIDYEYEELVTK